MPNSKNRPPGDPLAHAPKPHPVPAAPRRGFDPGSLNGGKHPGGKPLRGGKIPLPGKSRGR